MYRLGEKYGVVVYQVGKDRITILVKGKDGEDDKTFMVRLIQSTDIQPRPDTTG